MTATLPPRVCPQTGLRWGQVYGIDVVDHESWMAGTPRIVLNDYVGQSRQPGRARENQHRDDKPFSDLIVGSPRVLWEGYCTDEDLDKMERHFIREVEQRPRLNWRMNEDNRRQIPIPRQKEQRWARDAKRGAGERWTPTEYRPEVYGYRPSPVRRSKPWRPWQKHLLGIGITWKVLAVAALALLGWRNLLDADAALTAWIGALPSGLWGWFGFPGVGKRWRRRFRNARRRFR